MAEPEDFAARDRPHISINAFREATTGGDPGQNLKRDPDRNSSAKGKGALRSLLVGVLRLRGK